MPPATHTAADEDALMDNILNDINESFFNAVPSPDPSPVKPKAKPILQLTPIKSRKSPNKKPRKTPPKAASATDLDVAALFAGAEDWDWNDMEADFLTPKKEVITEPKNISAISNVSPEETKYIRDTCTRCIVEEVIEQHTAGRNEKVLNVKLDPGEERRTVVLYDDWTPTDVRVGDTINIIGDFTLIHASSSKIRLTNTLALPPTSTITISSSANFLILHPDTLLTATALSTAPTCARKPLLSLLVHSSSDTTPSLVWGNILHEVMQCCLREGRWDEPWIDEKILGVVRGEDGGRGLSDLVKLGVTLEEAVREVKARAKGLRAFGERYLAQTPKANAVLSDTRSTQKESSLLAITQLHDVEEDIWSPTYGIKGKLDATVQALITSPPTPSPFSYSSTNKAKLSTTASHPAPLEIKTGRAIAGTEHRAQTLLYTLLATERYATPVPSGLLYYTQSEEVVRVPVGRNELRGLIGGRNELASYIVRRSRTGMKRQSQEKGFDLEEPFLPPTLDDERTCKRCYALDTCMLYRKTIENVVDNSSPIADIYEFKTGHITSSQSEFFRTWENLISLEEQDMVRFKKELWTMGAHDREAEGRCFAGMLLQPNYKPPKELAAKAHGIHQYTYKFTRTLSQGESESLLSGHMSCGDAISVSVEPDLLALAKGFIIELTPQGVVIGVDHELNLSAISTRSIALLKARGNQTSPIKKLAPVLFRIDKDEMSSGMGRIRDNLAQLFYVDGDAQRLALVVDLKAPTFTSVPPALPLSTAHLNSNQVSALNRVLQADDYALILGMPGTGKTTVIAALIRVLVGMGKTVLLTSYTHSAVDTILAKMLHEDFGILRLGNVDKVHPDVKQFTLESRRIPSTVEQLEQQLTAPPVVATTCLSIDHALFSRRKFDYCIVDEASQITLPTCLGPLRFAEKFVLVGDHFQLPPLVRNPAARKGGLDVSLFRRLSSSHPDAVIDLTHQYRMNEDIMLLSNRLIYGDRLKCGNEEVAKRSLKLPDGGKFLRTLHAGKIVCGDPCWLERLLSKRCKAVFVDTDALPANDTRVGDLVQNPTEAALVRQITLALLRSGVAESAIGLISLYRQQIKLLGHLLEDKKDIELLTADRSQGRDKECIIISMVRSNEAGQIGDLVRDWRRMNVSFTRARSKLIIVGSRKTLQAAPLLAQFFALMESKGWILPLPKGADTLHVGAFGVGPCVSKGSSPGKRVAMKMESEKENIVEATAHVKAVKKPKIEGGLLKRRPLLQDLRNGEK